jgi:HD-like signal output (HDOD) protein
MDVAIVLIVAAVLVPALWLPWRGRGRAAARGGARASRQREPAVAAATVAPTPPLRPLLRRMYAVTMDAPELADPQLPIEGLQARVLEQAQAVLEQLDLQSQYMPRRPHLLPQLMRAVNDPAASGRAIARIIGQDPVLTANLLRIANSALYRRHDAAPVDSLERAVALVGTEGVRRIVAIALMQPVLSLQGGLFTDLSSAIWEYALHVAAAAADYAGRHGRNDDALSAQLLGLLQGLGALVVMRVLQETYARNVVAPPSLAVAAALLDRHALATARTVAAGWGLPMDLGQALLDLAPQHGGMAPATTLAAALRYGRLAAVLAALARAGQQSEEQALSLLATLEPDAQANARLWTRLRAQQGLG